MGTLNDAGLNLIKSFEGLSLSPYLDQVGVPTIGYGCTYYEDGVTRVTMNDPAVTEEQAVELLGARMQQYADYVGQYVSVPINDNQFSALVSFCYNLGPGSLHGSTLLKLLNSGADINTVAAEFPKWDKAGGQVVAGLLRRRMAEQALFLEPVV